MPDSFGNDVTIVPAGTILTADANGAAINIGNKGTLRAQVVVTAVSGTSPSDTITIETSHDAGATDAWRTVAAFSAVTAAGSSAFKSFPGLDRYIRAKHVVTGSATPTLTLGVFGEAV